MSAIPQSQQANRTAKSFSDQGHQLAPIDLYPSRRLVWAQMLGLSVMALAAPLALQAYLQEEPLWWLVQGVFWGFLVLGAWNIKLTRSQAPSGISYRNGDWYLILGSEECRAKLIGEVVVWQTLVVARFRLQVGAATVSLVCLPDSLKGDDFRRLKVWLRVYLWHRKA